MTADDIRPYLATKNFGRALHLYDSLESTNDTAKRLAADGAPEGAVVMALRQTAGRGRQDRVWISEAGKNLTFSVILRPRIDPGFLGVVSLFAAAAVAWSVSELAGRPAGCKWPNDVLIAGKKISGILSESAIAGDSVASVVVGVGLNVNQRDFPAEIAPKTTSVILENGRETALGAALGVVLGRMESLYRPSAAGWPAEMVAEWTKRNVILGSRVEAVAASSRIVGTARSVTPTGALRIEAEGRTVEVTAGEVHLV